MRYRLSQLIPIRFTSVYGDHQEDGSIVQIRSVWWQWRGRIWAHQMTPLA